METVTGGNETVATLSGSMGNGMVRWEVPMNKIGAVPGSTIIQGGDCAQMGSSLAIPGAVWFCNNAAGDQVFMDDDYIVPGPTVELPVPAEPGDYVVVAKACHGANNCALATTGVTI